MKFFFGRGWHGLNIVLQKNLNQNIGEDVYRDRMNKPSEFQLCESDAGEYLPKLRLASLDGRFMPSFEPHERNVRKPYTYTHSRVNWNRVPREPSSTPLSPLR